MLPSILVTLLLALVISCVGQSLHLRTAGGTLRWIGQEPVAYCFNTLLVWAWLLLWLAVTGNAVIACWVGGLIALVLAYVDYLCGVNREKPLLPRDFAMVLNLNLLAKMISVASVVLLVGGVAAAVALCLLLDWLVNAPFLPGLFRLVLGLLSALVLALFATLALPRNPLRKLLNKLGVKFDDYRIDIFGSFDRFGFFLAFFQLLLAPMMPEPKGYSPEAVEELTHRYPAASPAGRRASRPNVVLIMSEAFSDPTRLAGVRFDSDPIPYIRGLMEQTPSGQVLTPGYGGGTAHCECEVLTGLSTALCGDNSPYENRIAQWGRDSFPSLAGRMAANGYRTVALHPYTDDMYARPKAYRAMGFQDFIIHTGMTHRDKPDNSPYISDAAAYAETLDILNKGPDGAFVHLVTMQNHGDYRAGRFHNSIKAEGMPDSHRQMMETYAQGLRYTDEATKAFLEQLRMLDRETVVLFWGDHLPFGYPQTFYREDRLGSYLTPFFLWSSGERFEAERLGIRSPIFLGRQLLRGLEMPSTAFDGILDRLEERFHGIHMDFTLDSREEQLPTLKAMEDEVFRDYMIAQYDLLH